MRARPVFFCMMAFILAWHGVQGLWDDPENTGTFTVSGRVTDKSNGEELLGATVYVQELRTGTATNLYGFYSISLKPARYSLSFSYVGYQTIVRIVDLKQDTTLNIELKEKQEMLQEVEIKSDRPGEDLKKPVTGTFRMDTRTISSIPALMGEVDLLKAIQLTPGVHATSEGGSGFIVRGGGPDQNLILLDEATVYNASHLMGFFSVFNNDAIKDVTLYKGDIPAAYGGRLSSLLDVRMKEGNMKKLSGTGGIGTISSRLTLEGPILNDRISYIVSARRTYADLFLHFSNDPHLRNNVLYFYDINGKINFRIDDNNRLFFSVYKGKDIFRNPDFRMGWGNQTFTLRWNHLFSKKLFSNFTFINSTFDYSLGIPEGQANSFLWKARLEDFALKADFGYYLNPNNTIKFGISSIYHTFHPGQAKGVGEQSFLTEYEVPPEHSIESGLYVSNEQKIGALITLKYGLRLSVFNNMGPGVIYHFDDDYNVIDSTVYRRGDIFNTYYGLEPRVTVSVFLDEVSCVKASYCRNRQYIQLASNSTAGTPLDIWFPSSPNVKPQVSDQFTLGYFRDFRRNTIETSVEAFYKTTDHAIDFKDHAQLLLNAQYEGQLRFGTGRSYGVEFLVKRVEGRLTGWVSYTLSKSERTIAAINDGKTYVSPYDRPNNVAVVLSYDISPRISLGATWVYLTGAPVTFPTGGAWYQGVRIPVYSDRNAYRLPNYHRLDLSVTYRGKNKPGRFWHGELNLSVYNVYDRHNTWVINFKQEQNDPDQLYAEKTYLFGIIPALTYNFHF
jgi:hypothetical protein